MLRANQRSRSIWTRPENNHCVSEPESAAPHTQPTNLARGHPAVLSKARGTLRVRLHETVISCGLGIVETSKTNIELGKARLVGQAVFGILEGHDVAKLVLLLCPEERNSQIHRTLEGVMPCVPRVDNTVRNGDNGGARANREAAKNLHALPKLSRRIFLDRVGRSRVVRRLVLVPFQRCDGAAFRVGGKQPKTPNVAKMPLHTSQQPVPGHFGQVSPMS